MLAAHIGKPLSSVPDPFSNEYPSFAAHNNARLRRFLDRFGFEYEFLSATECYKAGMFDATLLRMLAVYDEGDGHHPADARARSAAPPIRRSSPSRRQTGKVLQVPMVERNPTEGTIVYVDPDTGEKVETPVTGGRVKCQWKADWALRWTALGVDYEMCGKDLIDSRDAVLEDLPGARRHAARELHLRAVPRRCGRQDLQVQGQRPHRRRVADLRLAGEPVAVHVSRSPRRPRGSTST